ncbi:hypothetical protein D910_01103, partial [Dendroctonus ponderosae]
RLLHQFEESGSVNYKKPITRKCATEDEENVFTIIGSVIENPNVSQNLISESTNIIQSSISRIIKKHNFYPYKIQLCQELDGNDFDEFCIDECTFHNNGLVNRHNFHYYSDTNPRAYRVMKNQNRTSKWFDVSPVSNKPSLNIIRKKSLSILEPTCGFNWMELRLISTAKWIGRDWFQNWPPRSPDLTPLDFCLWGYIKGIVYHTLPTTSHDMKTRIRDAFKTVTPQMLSRVSSDFEKRIYKCLEIYGQHFEH